MLKALTGAEAAAVVMRCLAKNPDYRWRTCGELRETDIGKQVTLSDVPVTVVGCQGQKTQRAGTIAPHATDRRPDSMR